MTATSNTFRVLSLVRFVCGKSRDFASHWMQRQLRNEASYQVFRHVLKDDFLVKGRGGHSVYIVDEETSLRFLGLLPREWKLMREMHCMYPDTAEEERSKMILEAYKAEFGDAMAKEFSVKEGKRKAVTVSKGRRPIEGHVLAAYKEGKGVQVSCVKKGNLDQKIQKLRKGQFLSSFECKDAGFMRGYIRKLLMRRFIAPHKGFFDTSKGEVQRLFKTMLFVKSRLHSNKQKKTDLAQEDLAQESVIPDEDLMASVFEHELDEEEWVHSFDDIQTEV